MTNHIYQPNCENSSSVNWHCSAIAFGDFIVDCLFMRFASPGSKLLAASYFRPLADAIKYDGPVRYFNMASHDIPPSLFNVRKAGIRDVLQSLVQLRRSILDATDAHDTVTVPHHDIRWRLACSPRRTIAVRRKHENIYLAYCAHLGLDAERLVIPPSPNCDEVLVFPDSRQMAKQIPEATLKAVTEANMRVGIRTRIVRVRPPDPLRIEQPGESSLWGLPNLVDCIRNAGAIVSADSLPGHLAEYFKRPAYILTPRSNEPLMPLSVLLCKRWSCFDDLSAYEHYVRENHA